MEQGIPDISTAHHRIISLIVDDDTLSKYSWAGTDQKLPFSELGSLNSFIVKVIRQKHKDYAKATFEKFIKGWLRHANERLQRKAKKNHNS